MKGLLDLIVLQYLNGESMHGYKIIKKIRKEFGVYFGPSTIYPLLNDLEEKGYVESNWDMESDRPRKVYSLTTEGRSLHNFTEDSLNFICTKIGTEGTNKKTPIVNIPRPTMHPLLNRVQKTKLEI
ncbi:MAG: PadR family transcriptional regulator [Candidatus Bathyarchaeota archaeon]|jgi:DNA-binding PadR family transcriptional regulator